MIINSIIMTVMFRRAVSKAKKVRIYTRIYYLNMTFVSEMEHFSINGGEGKKYIYNPFPTILKECVEKISNP